MTPTGFGQEEQDRLVTLAYELGLTARHATSREGEALRVDLRSYHYPEEVAMLSKGDKRAPTLLFGYLVRWMGRQTNTPGTARWYSTGREAMEAIAEKYRAKEAAWRLTGGAL